MSLKKLYDLTIFVVKCYHCRKKNTDNKKKHNIRCDPENRGELQTCVFDNEMCYKFIITKYNQKLEDNGNGKGSLPGESPHKGCGPFLRPNHTMGCQRWNEFNDICYCDEDRCNTHEHPKDLPY